MLASPTMTTETRETGIEAQSQKMPGIARAWDPRVWGTFVAAAGGTVFVLTNRGELADPWPPVALAAWGLVFVAHLWATLLMPRHFPRSGPISRSAPLVYCVSVIAMIAVIQLGRVALEQINRVDLHQALTVFAVGAHFFPFAKVFSNPFFTRLAWVMSTLGVLATIVGLAWSGTASAAVVVVNGLVMLALLTHYAMAMREPESS